MSAFPPYLILAVAVGALAATAYSGADPAPEEDPAVIVPEIGAPVPLDRVHLIERPGLYGVTDPAPGMRYGVVGSSLVRIDMDANVIRSVIRGGVQPID